MKWVRDNGGHPTEEVGSLVDAISAAGGTPLVVAEHVPGSPARGEATNRGRGGRREHP